MDPVERQNNLDIQDPAQPNPVAPARVEMDPRARSQRAAEQLGLTLAVGLEPLALVDAGQLERLAPLLQRDGFMLLDVVGTDYGAFVLPTPARFGVTYNFYQLEGNVRLFLRVYLEDGAALPSLYPVWKSANYLEREVYDLLGVPFEGHPDLRKILTPDDLEGHPLRKDFPIGESPTLFRDGRFLDPAAFRAGLNGGSAGLTGWRGGERVGLNAPEHPPVQVGGKS